MSTHTFRITVRGFFDALTEAQRSALLEEADVIGATERAVAATAAWLTDRGYGFKNLRPQAVDLAIAPLSKRQRRAAAGDG